MNIFTKAIDFLETPDFILKNSDLLIPEDCVEVDGVLYERINEGDYKYRFFFCTNDYDYLENEDMIKRLDKIFADKDKEL